MKKIRLDYLDLSVLESLQENCRASVEELARKTGSSVSTVYARIRRLEDSGMIKNYKAIVDPMKVGKGLTAFIFGSVSYGTPDALKGILREISSFSEVQEIHTMTTGNWDVFIKVRTKDLNELRNFIENRLRAVEGVKKTSAHIVLETTKETTGINLQRYLQQ